MNEHEFQRLMRLGKLAGGDYSAGYLRGLRRHYHGEKFGTVEEHEKWSGLGLDGDHRIELGTGYRDGVAGLPPSGLLKGRPTELTGGKRVNVYLDDDSLHRAEKLGDGNVSGGIRRALAMDQSENGAPVERDPENHL